MQIIRTAAAVFEHGRGGSKARPPFQQSEISARHTKYMYFFCKASFLSLTFFSFFFFFPFFFFFFGNTIKSEHRIHENVRIINLFTFFFFCKEKYKTRVKSRIYNYDIFIITMTALYNFSLVISLDIFRQRYALLFLIKKKKKNSVQQRTQFENRKASLLD